MQIGFITASDLSRYFPAEKDPLLTHDDFVAKVALESRGHSVEPVIWGTDPQRLQGFDLLVVRSPWDYMDTAATREGLFAWLRSVAESGLRIENHPNWLLWNSDKRYLKQLAEHGVAIVPTQFLEPDIVVNQDWLHRKFLEHGPFVLKPTVSAAAKDTFLINSAAIDNHLVALNGKVEGDFAAWRGGRCFMVQPFLEEIRTTGEWSLVYFRGVYSHAVLKRPSAGEWLVQDELGGSVRSGEPPSAMRSLADDVAATLKPISESFANPTPIPLYMRIDLIPHQGRCFVSELEMIEPELFFLSRLESGAHKNAQALELFTARIESI